MPRLFRAALDRQVVLGLAQLLTLLVLLLLNLALLITLLLLDLLLLLALDVALLKLLLLLTLDLALLVLLLLNLPLLIALLLSTLLLLLTLLRVFTGAAVKRIARWFITFVGQRLSTDAQTQQTYTRKLPDARFHAFLTRARVDVIKTV
ncbi:hypothetical protein [Pseudomonas syringae]|uniref:hypothetical protein n=1 Tax=Pseudomonas syringae TaxID=317 RepID=UPI00186493C8|nr:hypothetical protein [Pseudomonas syringae]